MKKYLMLFCILLLIGGCSKDDSDIIEFPIYITDDDIIGVGGEFTVYKYNSLQFSRYYYNKEFYTFDALCPNFNYKHIYNYALRINEDGNICCLECESLFSLETGKGINSQVEGKTITFYNMVYNKDTKESKVWPQ